MRGLLIVYKYTRDSNVYYTQIFTVAGSSVTWIRSYYINWSAWQQFSTDVPDFYKNYNTIGALAAGIGETGGVQFNADGKGVAIYLNRPGNTDVSILLKNGNGDTGVIYADKTTGKLTYINKISNTTTVLSD